MVMLKEDPPVRNLLHSALSSCFRRWLCSQNVDIHNFFGSRFVLGFLFGILFFSLFFVLSDRTIDFHLGRELARPTTRQQSEQVSVRCVEEVVGGSVSLVQRSRRWPWWSLHDFLFFFLLLGVF